MKALNKSRQLIIIETAQLQKVKKILEREQVSYEVCQPTIEKLTKPSEFNSEQIKQLESKIKLLEQQKETYQTKFDKSIDFIKEIRGDIENWK